MTIYRFWIAPSASIAGRMGLIITAYLILTNMSTSAHIDLPTFTAMDIWFYACRFLVGGAILEFLFVLRRSSEASNVTKVKPGPQKMLMQKQRSPEEQSARYDRNAFMIFNALFIVFCVIYFSACFSLR